MQREALDVTLSLGIASGRSRFGAGALFFAPAAACLLLARSVLADIANGEQVARQWCANCHVIDDGGPSGPLLQLPSLRFGAGHLGPAELRALLTHPHGQMPDISQGDAAAAPFREELAPAGSLTRSEIDDLIGYIESLR
jgi:mono/diheme cytochrome c family protein